MKKITSVLTLVCALFILIAGCKNAALPDPIAAANEELGAEGRDITLTGGAWTDIAITDASVPATVDGVANTILTMDGAEFVLSFDVAGNTGNFTPDKDALASAVTIYGLGEADYSGTATSVINEQPYPQVGSAKSVTVVYVNGKTARIKANLSGLTHDKIEIRIDAGKFTANGGRIKLNADDDLTPGEPEDDIYVYADVERSSTDTTALETAAGAKRDPRDYISITGVSFDSSLDDPEESRLYNQVKFTVNYADTENAKIIDFFKTNLKIDKYVDGSWSLGALAVTGVATDDTGVGDRDYIASFATASDRDILRVRLEKRREFETDNVYKGFKQKITSKDDDPDEAILVGPAYTLDQTTNTSGLIHYTPVNIVAPTSQATVIQSYNRNVYVRIPLVTGNLDIDDGAVAPVVGTGELSGVSNDTVKITAQSATAGANTFVNIEWESVSYEYGVADVKPNGGTKTATQVPTALLLKLPDSFKASTRSTWYVLITPGVRTSGGKAALPDIPPFSPGKTGVYFAPGIYTGIAQNITGSGNL
jgi:hypothetical protein